MAVDDRRRNASRSLRVSAWRGQAHIAVLNPDPDHPGPTELAVHATVDRLRQRGTERLITGALHAHETPPFLAAGFRVHEHLHLLRHDLARLPTAPDLRLRRPGRTDRATLLDVDNRAFDEFWALDSQGLDDAVGATPSSRVRVLGERGAVVAYAVTGRAAHRGYLQRLAVHPDHQRGGIGGALVADSLRWLKRRGATIALVNTQETNTGALALYLHLGFTPEPVGLTVLTLDLVAAPSPDPHVESG